MCWKSPSGISYGVARGGACVEPCYLTRVNESAKSKTEGGR